MISRPLFSLLVLLLLLGSWNCNNNTATESGEATEVTEEEAVPDAASRPHLFVQVDNLRMREGAGMEAKVIAELPEGTRLADLGEASKEMSEATLRGVKHKAPWLKVATESGLVGWVFGGAVSTGEPDLPGSKGEFKAYLATLQPNCDALAKARESLKGRLRKSMGNKEKDASVAAFHEFYLETVYKADDMSEQPGTVADFDLLAYNPDKKPIPAHVNAQIKEWEACGVGLEFPEGMLYLAEHPDYMVNHFANLASPAMKKYLVQNQQEIREGFSEDAGLTISPQQLAERLAFWDQFLAKQPAFVHKAQIEESQGLRIGTLMGGLDNTPAFGYDNGELDPEWRSAYEWLMEKHANTPSHRIIKGYYMMLKKSKWKATEKSWTYVKDYRGW